MMINTPLCLGSPDEFESPSPGLRKLKPTLLASPKLTPSKAYKINVTSTKKSKFSRKASRNSIIARGKVNSSNMSSKKSFHNKKVNLDIEVPSMIALGIKTGGIEIMKVTVNSNHTDQSCSPLPPSENESELQLIKSKEILPAVAKGGTSHQFLFD